MLWYASRAKTGLLARLVEGILFSILNVSSLIRRLTNGCQIIAAYIRVSTKEQNCEGQRAEIQK